MLHITTPDCIVDMPTKVCIVCARVRAVMWDAFFHFWNFDAFSVFFQLSGCCHSDVCGNPHCVPEVHGKFCAWPHQDKSYPMDGCVSSRACNLFWLPGDSASVLYSFITITKHHSVLVNSTLHIRGILNLNFILVTGCSGREIFFIIFVSCCLYFLCWCYQVVHNYYPQ